MTFIASIIAKDGIAVIADSLVSTMERSINYKSWQEFIDKKKSEVKEGEDFKLTEEDIKGLFTRRPSYTKDYESKLFQYDPFTLITTAGAANINNNRIVKVVSKIKAAAQKEVGYKKQTIKKKVDKFCALLVEQVKEHIDKHSVIAQTTFIISNYKNDKSTIYKITVLPNNKKTAAEKDARYLQVEEEKKYNVVCDGQSGIAYRILYGGVLDAISFLNNSLEVLKESLEKKGVKEGKKETLPVDFYQDFVKKRVQELIKDQEEEVYIFKLRNLSLQQASDLAYLLLKVERDFQAYTKDIPTVGGVVKLATITNDGINFILGKNIIKPTRHL